MIRQEKILKALGRPFCAWLPAAVVAGALAAGALAAEEPQETKELQQYEEPAAAASKIHQDAFLPEDEAEAARDALRAAEEAFNQKIMNRDREGVERWLAKDPMFLDQEVNRSKGEFLRLMQPLFEEKNGFTVELETKETHMAKSGELGWAIGVSKITFKNPWDNEETVNANHYLTVWTREKDQPWRVLLYSTLIVHPEFGISSEPRSALMVAWPELSEQIDAPIKFEYMPEFTIRAASGEAAFTFGEFYASFSEGSEQQAGKGGFATIWVRNDQERWTSAAEAYTPPQIYAVK